MLNRTAPVIPGAESFQLSGGGKIGCFLIHGYTATPQSMRELGERLARAGMDSYCPLLPGHGTRVEDLNNMPWDQAEQQIEEWFINYSRHYPKTFIVGESSGAVLGARLAIKYPARTAGLVSVGGAFVFAFNFLLPVLVPIVGWFVAAPKKIVALSVSDPEIAKRRIIYDRLPLRSFRGLVKLTRDTSRNLSRLTVPLFIQQSKKDFAVPSKSAFVVEKKASSKINKIIFYKHGFHSLLIDKDKDKVMSDIISFIREINDR